MKYFISEELRLLLEKAERSIMSDEERSLQRQSFAYSNVAIGNSNVTREIVAEESKNVDRTITKGL